MSKKLSILGLVGSLVLFAVVVSYHLFTAPVLAEGGGDMAKRAERAWVIQPGAEPVWPQEVLDRTVGVQCGKHLRGSGVLLEPGKVLTAYHVIQKAVDKGKRVFVQFWSPEGVVSIQVKSIAYDAGLDLAVLRVGKFGVKGRVRLAEPVPLTEVIALGSPLGVAPCVVSGTGVVTGERSSGWVASCAVVDGVSGGGVFDREGRLVGTVVATWREECLSSQTVFVPAPQIRLFLNATGAAE